MRPVFLSASVPDPRRDSRYAQTADVIGIRESILALVLVVLPRTRLVFGGHPAISPLVILAADRLQLRDRVSIFQSDYFLSSVPKESLAFNHITWTPAVANDRPQSLFHMRDQMFGEEDYGAGVFIGGMEGVEEEFAEFCRRHPTTPAYPIASTGGASLVLWNAHPGQDLALHKKLRDDVVYDALFRALPGVGC